MALSLLPMVLILERVDAFTLDNIDDLCRGAKSDKDHEALAMLTRIWAMGWVSGREDPWKSLFGNLCRGPLTPTAKRDLERAANDLKARFPTDSIDYVSIVPRGE